MGLKPSPIFSYLILINHLFLSFLILINPLFPTPWCSVQPHNPMYCPEHSHSLGHAQQQEHPPALQYHCFPILPCPLHQNHTTTHCPPAPRMPPLSPFHPCSANGMSSAPPLPSLLLPRPLMLAPCSAEPCCYGSNYSHPHSPPQLIHRTKTTFGYP